MWRKAPKASWHVIYGSKWNLANLLNRLFLAVDQKVCSGSNIHIYRLGNPWWADILIVMQYFRVWKECIFWNVMKAKSIQEKRWEDHRLLVTTPTRPLQLPFFDHYSFPLFVWKKYCLIHFFILYKMTKPIIDIPVYYFFFHFLIELSYEA